MNAVEFWSSVTGWTLFSLTGVFLYYILTFTPAMQFVRAKWKKVPLFIEKYKDTFADIKLGKKKKGDYTEVDGLPVTLSNNSQMIEKKSKVSMYFKFVGHGINTDSEYAALVQELNEKGYNVSTVEDLVKLIRLSSDDEYRSKYLENIKDEEEREQEKQAITSLQNLKIDIETYKTYTLGDMKNMFPFNINSNFVDGITEEEVTLALKRERKKNDIMKWMLVGSIAFSIVLVATAIFFTIYKPNSKVVCDCITAAANSVVM